MEINNKNKTPNMMYSSDYIWYKPRSVKPLCSHLFIVCAEQCMSCPEFRWCKSGQDRCFKSSNYTSRER